MPNEILRIHSFYCVFFQALLEKACDAILYSTQSRYRNDRIQFAGMVSRTFVLISAY